jgi:hypothetical protein
MGRASQAEVKRRFKRDITTPSRITSRIEEKGKTSSDLAEKIHTYINTKRQD